jgi:hypothetical protein
MTTRAFVTAQISCCYLAVPPPSLCALVDIVFREEEESCDDAVRGEASILRERERERESECRRKQCTAGAGGATTVLTVDIANSREVLRCVLDSLQKSFGRGSPVRGCTNRSMSAESSRVRAGYGSVRGREGSEK